MKPCKICGEETISGFIIHGECLSNLKVEQCSKNHMDHRAATSELSIVSIIHAVDYIALLSQFVNEENEILDDMEMVLKPFNDVIEELLTDEVCRHTDCDRHLYKSDLPDYDYVCPDCEENF